MECPMPVSNMELFGKRYPTTEAERTMVRAATEAVAPQRAVYYDWLVAETKRETMEQQAKWDANRKLSRVCICPNGRGKGMDFCYTCGCGNGQ